MSHIWAVRAALRGILDKLDASSNPKCKGSAEYIRENWEEVVGQLMAEGEADIAGLRLNICGSFFSRRRCPDCGAEIGANESQCIHCAEERVEEPAYSY